jgi:hypothetical protein
MVVRFTGVIDTILSYKGFQWLAAGRWFSPDTQVPSTNKPDRHDIPVLKYVKYKENLLPELHVLRIGETNWRNDVYGKSPIKFYHLSTVHTQANFYLQYKLTKRLCRGSHKLHLYVERNHFNFQVLEENFIFEFDPIHTLTHT